MKLRIYNNTLDPNLWNDKSLKPEVKDALLKIAEDFYNSTDLTGDIHNILFLGSSANYNWSPMSDLDLHIVIDIAAEKINEEYARKFMDGLACQWNTKHDIEIKGHPVEVYLQDVREPNSTPQLARPGAAIYSVYDDKWLLEPNPHNVQLDADKIRKKFYQLKDRIKDLIETENIDKLKSLMKSISNYRDAGLEKGGEFSVENLVFKALRKSGDLEKLKETITTLYDREASLPENGNIQPNKKTEPLNELLDKNSNLYLGFIRRDNLRIVGINVDDSYTHREFQRALGDEWRDQYDENLLFWRYKRSENSIYWWYPHIHPIQDEKEAVERWLQDNVNAGRYLQHRFMSNDVSAREFGKNRIIAHDPSTDGFSEGIYNRLVKWILS